MFVINWLIKVLDWLDDGWKSKAEVLRQERHDEELRVANNLVDDAELEKIRLTQENISLTMKLAELERVKYPKISFKKTNQFYRWKPGENIKLRNTLAGFSKDAEYLEKYISFLESLGIDDISNIDEQVKVIVTAVQKYVNTGDDYDTDTESFGVSEYWLSPQEAYDYYVEDKDRGDCFAGYEEIYVKDGLKRIDEIKEGDEVLSYDFETSKYVYKPIIKHWAKGKLRVNRVHLRNGQWFDVSEDHPMWHRINKSGVSKYEKQNLSEIDLTNWFKRKIPLAKHIPYMRTIPKWNKSTYRVIGHFLAEGWVESRKVQSSGYELVEEIIPILEQNNIPFSEYTNNSGVPCIRILKSEFSDYLRTLKTNSFDIHLPEEIFTLPEDYLEELLHGMWLGDGTKKPEVSGKTWMYATSSKKLAEDIQRIGLQLGRTFHIWKQENHGGSGNKSIYRITLNPNSVFLKDFGYEDISEVSIRYIEKLENVEMYDLTVKDTHTVILKNGAILHQCEDTSAFLYGCIVAKLIQNGLWEENKHRLKRVDVQIMGSGGHAVLSWLRDNGVHVLVESTFYEERFPALWVSGQDLFRSVYVEIWHVFDEESEYRVI